MGDLGLWMEHEMVGGADPSRRFIALESLHPPGQKGIKKPLVVCALLA